MLNKTDLQREVCSLDLLIRAVSYEIVRQPEYRTRRESPSILIKEMEEALYELRQARGLRKILLTALENERGQAAAGRKPAGATSQHHRLTLSSNC